MSAQELINTAIESALSHSDSTSNQYLKLRQDALELSTRIQKEVANNGQIDNQSQLKLARLSFEKKKIAIEYSAHINRLLADIKFGDKTSNSAVDKLQIQYEHLSKVKKETEDEIQRLQDIQGPVVEKMHKLVEDYNLILDGKRPAVLQSATEESSDESTKEVTIDETSYTFTVDEIKAALAREHQMFKAFAEKEGLAPREMLEIDIDRQLECLLKTKAYSWTQESTFKYDKAASEFADLGNGSVSMGELEQGIDALTSEILSLAEKSQISKSNWEKNASLLELLRLQVDHDRMDVDE